MEFTAEELAVLSQIAYYDIEIKNGKPKSLDRVLQGVENNLADDKTMRDILGDDLYVVYQGMMEKGVDYQVISSVNDNDNSGFVAFAVADSDGNATVVCRGSEDLTKVVSDPDSRKDLDTDIQIGVLEETDQQQALENMVSDLEERGYDSFWFTGHSLGGNLAIHGAVYLGDPDKVRGVTTFNAPGFNDKYWSSHRMRLEAIGNCVDNYENTYDYVSSIFTKPGERIVVDSVVESSNLGFAHHSICNLKIGDGIFTSLDSKGKRSAIPWVATNGLVDVAWDIGLLGKYLNATLLGGSMSSYRDFSKAALDTMVAAAKETEEEDWWNITRWDCWYRLDSLVGGPVMNAQYLAGDVDTYYRKLIDINDASVADIEGIFGKVYSVDDQYAAAIKDCSSRLESQINTKLREFAAGINANANGANGSSTHTSSSGAQHGGGGGRFGQAGGSSTHTSSSGAQHGGSGRKF